MDSLLALLAVTSMRSRRGSPSMAVIEPEADVATKLSARTAITAGKGRSGLLETVPHPPPSKARFTGSVCPDPSGALCMNATYPPLTSNAGTVQTTEALAAAPPVMSSCLSRLNREGSRFPGETAPVRVTLVLVLPRVIVAGHATRIDSEVQLSVRSSIDAQPAGNTANAMSAE